MKSRWWFLMAKVNIPKSEETIREEQRKQRIEEIKGKKQPTNEDIIQLLTDVYEKLEDMEKRI